MESELSEKYILLKKIVDLETKVKELQRENKELKETMSIPITTNMLLHFIQDN